MSPRQIPRLVLAGTGSGCGKTTVTCAVLGALKRRGIPLAAFKCGPDYIDPMFHSRALGVPSRNLDSFLCDEGTVTHLFDRAAKQGATAIVEGVMGFYDGLPGGDGAASTWDIARILGAPVVLVCSGRGKSLSLAAELRGFRDFLPNTIAGVILNDVLPHSFPMLREVVERYTGLPALGFLPHMPAAEIESRHLGLKTAAELTDLEQKLELLAGAAERYIDLDRLLALAGEAPPLESREIPLEKVDEARVAIAMDRAFCFYYQDNLDLLENLGVKLIPFSPLEDGMLPPDIGGLILGGGYPELYARELSENADMLAGLRQAVRSGMPVWAECGGFMTLCDSLATAQGQDWPMAGAIPARVRMTGRLSRFGYLTLTARKDNLFCQPGDAINAHSFHYSEADRPGDGFAARKPSGDCWETVHVGESLYAGYPHLHLWGNLGFARRFAAGCAAYQMGRGSP